jgi:outer membrane protein assembly factor BamB
LLYIGLFTIACSGLGSKKTKSVSELTVPLKYEGDGSLNVANFETGGESFLSSFNKAERFKVSPYKIISDPCIVKEVVYGINSSGEVFAFNLEEKKISWKYKINSGKGNSYDNGQITYEKGKLYVTDGSDYLTVLDATNGHEIIRKSFFDIIRVKPIIVPGTGAVLVQTVSNKLFSYDPELNQINWLHEGTPKLLISSSYVPPMFYSGDVLAFYSSGNLSILDSKDGREKINIDFSSGNEMQVPDFEQVAFNCNPIIDRGSLYLSSGNGKLLKINMANGEVLWEIEAYDVQAMKVLGDVLLLVNNARQVAALNTWSGKIEWLGFLHGSARKNSNSLDSFAPFVALTERGMPALNVLTSSGELYSFEYDKKKGNLSVDPIITKIQSGIRFVGLGGHESNYLVINNEFIRLNK